MSPTIHREGPFRFFFYSNENSEPAHVHVECGDGEAKLWLDGAVLAFSRGLGAQQLKRIVGIVKERKAEFQEAWHEHFAGR